MARVSAAARERESRSAKSETSSEEEERMFPKVGYGRFENELSVLFPCFAPCSNCLVYSVSYISRPGGCATFLFTLHATRNPQSRFLKDHHSDQWVLLCSTDWASSRPPHTRSAKTHVHPRPAHTTNRSNLLQALLFTYLLLTFCLVGYFYIFYGNTFSEAIGGWTTDKIYSLYFVQMPRCVFPADVQLA